jgi:hypothetical protein
MTVLADISQLAPVGIILLMTGITVARGFAVFFIALVTTVAGQLTMTAQQFEIGLTVIEGFGVEHHDPLLAPLVIGMTVPALVAQFRLQPAMEALLAFDIAFDFGMIVAGETTIHLAVLFQCLVTLLAFLLEPCMTFDQFTRHQQ